MVEKKTPNLLEEIRSHRNQEFKECSGEEGAFVWVNASTFWIDLFVRNFVGNSDKSHDDLLLFVRKKCEKTGRRYIPKFETDIEVFRKDSKKLPIGDLDIDWEETIYLNLILQHFEYLLTCAVCTRTSSKELQILRKHSQQVYASPSRRSMDGKGEGEEMCYPLIFFTVDNYEEVLSKLTLRDGEMICVELVASDKSNLSKVTLFNGSIHYESMKRVYEARSSVAARGKKRAGLSESRVEFVRMRGPGGKGQAEMAVSKAKGADVETPSSEPGFSVTDTDWEELEENPYSRRRMSDPSSNLKSCVRGWQSRRVKKSKSDNEGVDSYANGVTEIEAADLRDELDDVSQKRLWTLPGFSQAYHSWRETKRTNSLPLHSYLTFVTLPWHHIIADLINSRQQPLLTF